MENFQRKVKVNNKKVIMLELNELTPSLIHKFMAEGHLPNFKKIHAESKVYTTDANASGEELNPWIQWVSVHTGLAPKEHGVFLLNEMKNFDGDFMWDQLSNKGISSWVCGSMNAKYKEGFKGHFIPDPWATGASAYPANKFDTYFDFISQSVHGHASNEHVSAINFVKYMLGNGLSFTTLVKIATQVISEVFNKSISWKRALVLDWIQFDIFKNVYVKEQPQFATFFSNSTAHYQHHYWRDMDPEAFGEKPGNIDKTKSGSILLAYRNMDSMLGKILSLIDDNTSIVFVTALSQKPYLNSERHYYHIHNIEVFLKKFKVQFPVKYKPVMAEQFHLECDTVEEACKLAKHLESFDMDSNQYFHVGSNQVLLVDREGVNVHVQCRCTKETHASAQITNKTDGTNISFGDVFYHMDEMKSGMHDPNGMLWMHNTGEAPHVIKEAIALEQTHQLVLDLFKG